MYCVKVTMSNLAFLAQRLYTYTQGMALYFIKTLKMTDFRIYELSNFNAQYLVS